MTLGVVATLSHATWTWGWMQVFLNSLSGLTRVGSRPCLHINLWYWNMSSLREHWGEVQPQTIWVGKHRGHSAPGKHKTISGTLHKGRGVHWLACAGIGKNHGCDHTSRCSFPPMTACVYLKLWRLSFPKCVHQKFSRPTPGSITEAQKKGWGITLQ